MCSSCGCENPWRGAGRDLRKPPTLDAWTDYPMSFLGDIEGEPAPVRKVEIISYDGDKYCDILVGGMPCTVKRGYLYQREGRYGRVPPITDMQLLMLEEEQNDQT